MYPPMLIAFAAPSVPVKLVVISSPALNPATALRVIFILSASTSVIVSLEASALVIALDLPAAVSEKVVPLAIFLP